MQDFSIAGGSEGCRRLRDSANHELERDVLPPMLAEHAMPSSTDEPDRTQPVSDRDEYLLAQTHMKQESVGCTDGQGCGALAECISPPSSCHRTITRYRVWPAV